MKTGCAYYRDWEKDGMPHWCISGWRECTAMGEECPEFTTAITAEDVRK